MMSGISGRNGTGSSASAALTLSLASKFLARTEWTGSTLYQLTWKAVITPLGRVLFARRASVPRTSGIAYTGWPTPTVKAKSGGATIDPDKVLARARGGHSNDLQDFVQLAAGWPTPKAEDAESTGFSAKRLAAGKIPDNLHSATKLLVPQAGWSTPTARDGQRGGACTARDGYGPSARPASGDGGRMGNASTAGLPHAEPQDIAGTRRREEGRATEQPSGPFDPWRELEWIDCRDGKIRPIESSHVRMVAGNSAGVGRLRSTSEDEGLKYGTEDNAGTGAAVPSLRSADGEEAIPGGGFGAANTFCEENLLRPALHGECHGRANESSERKEQPSTIQQGGKSKVSELRANERQRTATCSSPRLRSHEQFTVKFDDIVRLLSPSLSLAEFHGDRETARALRTLRDAISQAGAMCNAPHTVSEIWESLDDQSKARIGLCVDLSRWVAVNPFPLAPRHSGDVGKLRAYGNAINAVVAREFIAAAMECLP